MPLPRNRSRSGKRMPTRTPNGKNVEHYKSKRPGRLGCRICGAVLGGVKNSRRASASEKTPTRIFAGQLCAGCASEVIKMKSRIRIGEMRAEEASHAQREFIKMLK